MKYQLLYANHGHIVNGGKGWRTVREPLPDDAVERHLNGGPRYGVPFVRPVENTVMAGMIDIDDHDGSAGWERVTQTASELMDSAAKVGVILHPYRSGGGKGINLWAIWEQPQSAAAVKALLESVVVGIGLAVGAGGIAVGQVEVFPKQGAVGEGEVGNCAALPRTALCPWTLEDIDAQPWESSATIVVEPASVVVESESVVETLTTEQLSDLLRFVPVAGIGYDEWWRRIMGIHDAGGSIEMAREWSRRDPAYAEDDGLTEAKWRSIGTKQRSNRVTVRTLMKLAAAEGWGGLGAQVEAFPVAVEPVSGELLVDYERVIGKGRYGGYVVTNSEQLFNCVSRDPEFPFKVSFDEFLQEIMVSVNRGTRERLQDHHYYEMRRWCDRHRWEPVDTKLIREAVDAAAKSNRTDLALEWAESLKWDGVDRYSEMLRRMGVVLTPYHEAVIRYLWTSHGARLLRPGHQADSIIVLISPEQGVGKTQLINALAPKICGVDTYQNIHIDHLLVEDKAGRALRGCLIANLDEMRNFSKRESAEIKAALSRMKESYIPKYKESRLEFGRRCMIYATNNEVEFLDDSTGNRRYHPLRVGRIDLQWFGENVEQLWAQGIAHFKQSGQAWHEAAQLATGVVRDHIISDTWDDAIRAYLDTAPVDFVRTGDIMRDVLQLPIDRQDRRAQQRVVSALRLAGWERRAKRLDGSVVNGYHRPPPF